MQPSLTLTMISFCSGDVRANTISCLLIKTFQSSRVTQKRRRNTARLERRTYTVYSTWNHLTENEMEEEETYEEV